MRPRVIGLLWVLVAVVSLMVLAFEVSRWRALNAELARADSERQRLSAEITSRQKQIAEEMGKSSWIQEMQWTSEGTDPAAFLNRMAELAREKRIIILGIGPLERQSSAQFTKSWHTIQVQAPYREIRDLAARIEQDRGIIENLQLEPVPAQSDQAASAGRPRSADEVRARFRMTTLELTPEARMIIERARSSSAGGAQATPQPGLALPVPSSGAPATAAGRDPFAFLAQPPRVSPAPSKGGQAPGPEGPQPPPVPLDLKGIVSFPDGFLAIINNQIVKVGDSVSGYRVDRITESSVTLSQPGASPRTINLPELASAPPAPPRR